MLARITLSENGAEPITTVLVWVAVLLSEPQAAMRAEDRSTTPNRRAGAVVGRIMGSSSRRSSCGHHYRFVAPPPLLGPEALRHHRPLQRAQAQLGGQGQ